MPTMIKRTRVSFPNVHKPSGFGDSDPKYSITCLIPKDSDLEKQIKAEMEQGAKATFGTNASAILKKQQADGMRALLKDGDEKLNKDGEPMAPGHWMLKGSNKAKPLVIDRKGNQLDEDSGLPYGGCYCNVQVDIWGQNNQFGKWLNVKLLGVQFVEDGDSFGGKVRSSVSDFEIEDDDTQSDW